MAHSQAQLLKRLPLRLWAGLQWDVLQQASSGVTGSNALNQRSSTFGIIQTLRHNGEHLHLAWRGIVVGNERSKTLGYPVLPGAVF
jgi:hypothetical protein